MLRKIDTLLKQCKGKTTTQKFEALTKKIEGLVRVDFDFLMRGNNIPYRVTVANGVPKAEWDATPDKGQNVQVEDQDPDKLGKLLFAAVMETRKPTDTTLTFIDFYSETIRVRVKGDNFHDPVFIAHCRVAWNGALDDHLREQAHKEIIEKNKESWRRSL